jgi:hypothetical protein
VSENVLFWRRRSKDVYAADSCPLTPFQKFLNNLQNVQRRDKESGGKTNLNGHF